MEIYMHSKYHCFIQCRIMGATECGKREILVAVNIEIIIFWDVIPCTPVHRHQHFRGTYLTTQSKFRTGSHDKCYVTFLSSFVWMMNQYSSFQVPFDTSFITAQTLHLVNNIWNEHANLHTGPQRLHIPLTNSLFYILLCFPLYLVYCL